LLDSAVREKQIRVRGRSGQDSIALFGRVESHWHGWELATSDRKVPPLIHDIMSAVGVLLLGSSPFRSGSIDARLAQRMLRVYRVDTMNTNPPGWVSHCRAMSESMPARGRDPSVRLLLYATRDPLYTRFLRASRKGKSAAHGRACCLQPREEAKVNQSGNPICRRQRRKIGLGNDSYVVSGTAGGFGGRVAAGFADCSRTK
jgi:hypothetical protein